MWRDYSDTNNVSYEVYQKVFRGENIGFARPNQDECDVCRNAQDHQKTLPENHESETCEVCQNWEKHKQRAESAREAYADDRANMQAETEEVFTADMQKVILLPKLKTKMHFFTSRLVVFNETFASLSGRNDLTVLWHEAISGRLAADVASAYIKCIVTCNKEAITFWADNCPGKNKNWTLFTSLAWCVNEE